jgi:hypothetical protein
MVRYGGHPSRVRRSDARQELRQLGAMSKATAKKPHPTIQSLAVSTASSSSGTSQPVGTAALAPGHGAFPKSSAVSVPAKAAPLQSTGSSALFAAPPSANDSGSPEYNPFDEDPSPEVSSDVLVTAQSSVIMNCVIRLNADPPMAEIICSSTSVAHLLVTSRPSLILNAQVSAQSPDTVYMSWSRSQEFDPVTLSSYLSDWVESEIAEHM